MPLTSLKLFIITNLKNLNFEKALQFINGTIEFQPKNELLNALKGETHFYRQEYSEAVAYLSKAGSYSNRPPYKLMLELAPKYAKLIEDKEFLNAEDFAELIFLFDEPHRALVWGFEKNKIYSGKKYLSLVNDPTKAAYLKNHMELCRLLIKRDHKNIRRLKLNYQYTLDNDGINLDLSGSKKLDRLKYITHLPMKSLNVENTDFWRQWIFSHYHLKSVNLTNTNIERMSHNSLNNSKFSEVILSKKQYDESDIRGNVKKKISFVIK